MAPSKITCYRFIKNEDTELFVDKMYGIRSTYPGLYVHPTKFIVLLNRDRSHRVALLTASGAGHEPFPTGFVGENMLTGAVNGPIFDVAPVGSLLMAIRHLAEWNKGGVLILNLNTSASKLSINLAMERAKASGIKVETTLIQDDCSLSGANGILDENVADRRSLSGALICFKILGGMSASGATMEELLWEEKAIKARTASASICYAPCIVPHKNRPQFRLQRGIVSLGVGINGEEGGRYTFKFRPLNEIIELLVPRLLQRCLVYEKGSVVVMVNCLGCLTKMECYLIANGVTKELGGRGVEVSRLYVGTAISSLAMKGFSLTLTNVTGNEQWLDLLDLETEASSWPGCKLSRPAPYPHREFVHDLPDVNEMCGRELSHSEINDLKSCILAVCKALTKHKDQLNSLCKGIVVELGTEMNRFAEATLMRLKKSCTFLQNLQNAFLALAAIAEETMSTSAAGSIYSLLLLGAAQGASGLWTEIWESAVSILSKYNAAKIGHRSLMDVLIPACGVFRRVIARDGDHAWRFALKAAVETAEETCAETKNMVSKAAKSAFYEQSGDSEEAGSRAVVIILRAIFSALCPEMEQPGTTRRSRRISSITYVRRTNFREPSSQ